MFTLPATLELLHYQRAHDEEGAEEWLALGPDPSFASLRSLAFVETMSEVNWRASFTRLNLDFDDYAWEGCEMGMDGSNVLRNHLFTRRFDRPATLPELVPLSQVLEEDEPRTPRAGLAGDVVVSTVERLVLPCFAFARLRVKEVHREGLQALFDGQRALTTTAQVQRLRHFFAPNSAALKNFLRGELPWEEGESFITCGPADPEVSDEQAAADEVRGLPPQWVRN